MCLGTKILTHIAIVHIYQKKWSYHSPITSMSLGKPLVANIGERTFPLNSMKKEYTINQELINEKEINDNLSSKI